MLKYKKLLKGRIIMPRVYQSTKDFTEEEKAVILTRLKTQKAVDIAKDLGTSWQVIVALQNASRKVTKRSHAKRIKIEKRDAILARAAEIGVAKAAEEAGVSKWTIAKWRRNAKITATKANPTPAGISTTTEKTAPIELPVSHSEQKTYTALEFENAILKEQIAAYEQQLDKLRLAMTKLL